MLLQRLLYWSKLNEIKYAHFYGIMLYINYSYSVVFKQCLKNTHACKFKKCWNKYRQSHKHISFLIKIIVIIIQPLLDSDIHLRVETNPIKGFVVITSIAEWHYSQFGNHQHAFGSRLEAVTLHHFYLYQRMCSCSESVSGELGGCPCLILLTGLGSREDRELPHFNFHFPSENDAWRVEKEGNKWPNTAPLIFIPSYNFRLCSYMWQQVGRGDEWRAEGRLLHIFVIFSCIQHNESVNGRNAAVYMFIPYMFTLPHTFKHKVLYILRGKKLEIVSPRFSVTMTYLFNNDWIFEEQKIRAIISSRFCQVSIFFQVQNYSGCYFS